MSRTGDGGRGGVGSSGAQRETVGCGYGRNGISGVRAAFKVLGFVKHKLTFHPIS